jgi:hypothetical protein
MPKIGVIYAPSAKLSLGAAASKPFYVTSSGKYRLQKTKVQKTGVPGAMDGSQTTDVDVAGADTLTLRLVSPWEISAGAAYFITDKTMVASDFIFYTPDSKFVDHATVTTYNWSVGAETYLGERVPIRLGLFSNNPNIPALKSGGMNQLPYVKMLGVAAGLTFLSPGSSVSITSTYSFGTGGGQVVSNSVATQEVVKSSLAVFLSGSYQM